MRLDMLTNAAVKAARPRAAAYKIGDGQGLYLAVLPSGTKSFRMKARFAGKELLLTFGCWPEISLADARDRRDQARARLAQGVDPRIVPAAETFEAIARAWHAHRAPTWSTTHAGDVLVSLERDAFPAIGSRAIGAISAPEVLALLEAVAARGAAETARRLCQRISGIFRFAIARELASADPAAAVADELARARPVQRQPALTDLGEIHALLARSAELRSGAVIQLASRFLALTAVRLAAVRGARWREIEDLDGPAPTWRVPAARMKLAAAKKGDAAHDHVVPLSCQAVALLRAAAGKMHSNDANMHGLIFSGAGGTAAIGEAAIGDLYKRAGFGGRHVPHGWRASFSTILNERSDGADRSAIDQALAHTPKDRVEAAYNRSSRLELRRRLFQDWADLIEPRAGLVA